MKRFPFLVCSVLLLSVHALYGQFPLFTPSDTILCPAEPVSFTNNCPNLLGYTYDWQFGDGNSDTSHTHTQHAYSNPDTFSVSLTMGGNAYLYILSSFSFHYLNPQLWQQIPFDILVDPYFTLTGAQSSQHNYSSNEGQTNVGQGNSTYTQSPNHHLGLQSYTVSVYDHDDTGNDDFIGSFPLNIPGGSGSFSNADMQVSWVIDSIPTTPYSQDIIVQAGPTFPFISGPDTVCRGDTIMLIANTTPGASLQWFWFGTPVAGATQDTLLYPIDFGGSNFGLEQAFTVQVSGANGGCQSVSLPHTIVSYGLPSAQGIMLTPNTTICEGESITLQSNSGQSSQYYDQQWFHNGTLVPGATGSQFTVSDSGTYEVLVINAAYTGCSVLSEPATISIFPDTSISIWPSGNQVLCQGESISLHATSFDNAYYQWYKDGWAILGQLGLGLDSLVVTQSGDYFVRWTLASPCGADTSETITVDVFPPPQIPVISGPVSPPCFGTSTLLTFQADTGILYQWQLNGVDIPGATGSSISATQDGAYSVVATNAGFCQTSSAEFSLQFSMPPAVPLIQINATPPFCEGQPLLLSSSGVSNVSYQWFLDGQIIPGATQDQLLADSSGIYSLEVSNAEQCSSESDTLPLIFCPSPAPPMLGSVGGESSFCVGESLALGFSPADPDALINWYHNHMLLPGISTDSLEVTEAGDYQVIVSYANGCSTSSSPMHIDTLSVPQPIVFDQGNGVLTTLHFYSSYAWMALDTNIVLATTPTFPLPGYGTYVVEVTNSEGCRGISSVYEHYPTAIEELPQLLIRLYPNPSTGHSFLDLPRLDQEIYVAISDLKGRLLSQKALSPIQTGQVHSLQLSQVADGVYVVQVLCEGYQAWTHRLLISR